MIRPRKTLDSISPYKTDKYKKNWIYKLDSNENIYGCDPNIINVVKNITAEEISLYPCYGELIDKLASKYGVSDENLIITNGCDEALSLIINSYLEKEDEILSYTPSFSMPLLYAQAAGGFAKLIDYDEKFVFDEKKFQENISQKTKIAYIATPNNPTGEVVQESVVENLLKENENLLFIIDCTYTNFSNVVAFENYVNLTKKFDNVAVVKSFSKDFALAGLRVGFAVSNCEIIKNLKKISSPYNVNALAMRCACAALEENKFNKIKQLNFEARSLLYKGLKELGFKPFKSEANFILCDFGPFADFYYEKLRKNGVIVRNYAKNSPISTCLRLTVPKFDGVDYILELLKKKDLLIFDLDGVVFDVSKSYLSAIKETFKHFSGYDVDLSEITEVKNSGGMNCDWDATKCLLARHGFEISLSDVINVFQGLFYNPEVKKNDYLIDKEKLLIKKEVFERLSKKYDLAVFSGRLKEEANYSLEKYEIDKYFYYFVTSDDLPKNMLKPHPEGVLNILKHCPHKSVKYLGDSVDDVIAGNKANVETIGVISPEANYNAMKNNFKHLGANHILPDVSNLLEFLSEIENEPSKNI